MDLIASIKERLIQGLNEKAETLSSQLAKGQATDFTAYREKVGRIGGLRDAADLIDETFRRLTDEDE